ncbi:MULTISPECIES: competence pheromone ComX [Bacillus]|uniref:competence pheromone ComX n=1 Tax=Bacillus TaxID=1386 RepID=UPI0003EDA090|nr:MULTISPECIES: competence pheromone ComX [Bacillus]EWH21023.1 quorum-sensing pheromone [Bacillus haynesii]MCY7862790.1 competence pheromone ComX [Bacillus haynesii]MCY7913791.1 competence pheromone ComX [Bacillus haynesii]MCY7924707.1 competence pheromone ComX [Bacillus haynesii]MCY7999310.1 competence pheromone ComX [Bacillus haynesii]
MQEIVNFLVQHPEVLEQVIAGRASLLGVDQDQILSIIDGFVKLDAFGKGPTYWIYER